MSSADNDILQRLEAESRRRQASVRQMIAEAGRPELVAKFDADMRDVSLGLTAARSAWHSVSQAQRRVLLLVTEDGCRLVRSAGSARLYDAVGPGATKTRAARQETVRNLAGRELLAWEGGAFDPEAAAVGTERAAFVVRHGRPGASTK